MTFNNVFSNAFLGGNGNDGNVSDNNSVCDENNDNWVMSRKIWWLFTLLCVFFGFFYGNAHYLILDMNEGLYAEAAREMFVTKDYVIPHLNGVPYLEKPPMLYWLITLSYKLFGVSTFAARLIPSFSSALVSLLLVLFGWYNGLTSRASCVAVIIFATSIITAVIGRVVFFDMLLTLWITAALFCFLHWYRTDNVKCLWGAYLLVACAFLTKGPIAICVAGGVAMAFMLLHCASLKKIAAFFNPVGIAIFLVITMLWVIPATLKLPGFAREYFVNEQLLRFLNKRIPHDYHTGPFYFYIPRVMTYLLPWTFFLPSVFGRIRGKIAQQNIFKLFLWVWFLFTLLFFSLSGDKGDYYMIVGAPPLVLLLGIEIENLLRKNKHFLFAMLFYVLSLGSVVALIVMLLTNAIPLQAQNLALFTLIFCFAYMAAGSFGVFYVKKAAINFFLIAGFIFPSINFYVHLQHLTEDTYTQSSITNYILSHDVARRAYLFKDYEIFSTTLFFLQRPLSIIDSASKDLYFGAQTGEAKEWFINHERFLQNTAVQPVYVIVSKKRLGEFQAVVEPLQFHVVAESARAVVMERVG